MKKRHGAEQIVAKLRQADVELGKGLKVPEVCKQLGVSETPSVVNYGNPIGMLQRPVNY